MAMPLPRTRPDAAPLADPSLRAALVAMVRRRVPAHEVDEIVQATLADALASSARPAELESLRRWVRGIARHKVIDFHRARGRETSVEDPDELAAPHAGLDAADPNTAVDLLRWAEREIPAPNQARTLGWMLREGDGEKLESIAREESLPAPQVRQRVARLRRHYRLRWAAQLAAAATIAAVIGAFVVYLALGRATPTLRDDRPRPLPAGAPTTTPAPESTIEPALLGRALRRAALERCQRHEWYPCLRGLDDAAMLDPSGDRDDAVSTARQAASGAIAPPPTPSPSTSTSTSAPPPPSPKVIVPPTTGKGPPPNKKTLDPFDVF